MSSNSSKPLVSQSPKYWWMAVALPGWVALSFYASEAAVIALLSGLLWIGVPLESLNATVFQVLADFLVYGAAIFVALWLPWKIKKLRTTRAELGYTQPMRWLDMLLAPAAYVIYAVLSALALNYAKVLFPSLDLSQSQDTGFVNLGQAYQYVLAFIMLVVLAPIAEETLFRGYLFGKLRKYVPLWAAILITSLLFAAIHGQWNVAIDVFIMSLAACGLRLLTGSLWAPILLHMIKNGVAFYFLFLSPVLLHTLGG